MSTSRVKPLTPSALCASPWGNAGGPTFLHPLSPGSFGSRSPPAGGVTWACVPRGGAGAEPPGGAPGADTRPAVSRSLETLLLLPGTSPQSPHPGERGWSSGLRKADPGAIGVGTCVAGRAPGFPGSLRVSARCPTSARRAPQPGWGTGCAGERPPRPAAAAAARELCRRLAPVRSSCSSFPGNFRPGIPPGRRAAPPAQPGPGASAGRPGLRARGARLETPTAHSPPELGPLDRASWCDTDGGASRPGSGGRRPLRMPSRWVCAPPLCAGWEGGRAGEVRVSLGLRASKGGEAGAGDHGLSRPSF